MVFFVFGIRFIAGSQTLVLTLDDSIERAVNQSITLQKNAVDLELAQFRSQNLWSELFPSFSLKGGLTFLPDTALFTDPGFRYNQNGATWSASFGISMSFNAGIPYSMKLTELAYRRGLLDFENARQKIALDVTKSFYSLLAGQVNITNLGGILDLAERQLEKNRIARENGLIGELSWLQSSLSAETARYNYSIAQSAFDSSLNDFLATLGIEINTQVTLDGSIVPSQINPDAEKLILEYLPKRPDIIAQRQTIERLELSSQQSSYSAKAPSLSLSAGWSGGPSRNTGITGKFSDSLSGSLSLTIPVDPWIAGTKSNQSLRSNDAELQKARLDLVNTETSAKSQIRSLCGNLVNSWKSIEIARLRVDIAQRTYELSDAGFRNGTVEFLNLETTVNDLADARYRLLQSELSYLNITLDLANALNVDLDTLNRSGE